MKKTRLFCLTAMLLAFSMAWATPETSPLERRCPNPTSGTNIFFVSSLVLLEICYF